MRDDETNGTGPRPAGDAPADAAAGEAGVRRAPTERLLDAAHGGDKAAHDALFDRVYDELHRAADALMRREQGGHLLSATALVHEGWLRLHARLPDECRNRADFLRVAATVMRNVLVDDARKRKGRRPNAEGAAAGQAAARRAPAPLGDDVADPRSELDADTILAIHEALIRLKDVNPRLAQIVELHYFGGLDADQIGEVIGVLPGQVRKLRRLATAWLQRELRRGQGDRRDSALDGGDAA